MGRWDEGGKPRNNRNLLKLIKKIIYLGFIIIALIILAVFIPRLGLNIELMQQSGDLVTISTKINNNNFYTIHNITVQFDNGKIQYIGDLGPFGSVMISPETKNINFKQIIVKANNGQIESIKSR
ncbi:MAG: hypothetical protein M3Z01_02460 [Thermoproteota archaeon]|nr:hypothetical protein [Thermoproteota archaeon]